MATCFVLWFEASTLIRGWSCKGGNQWENMIRFLACFSCFLARKKNGHSDAVYEEFALGIKDVLYRGKFAQVPRVCYFQGNREFATEYDKGMQEVLAYCLLFGG